MQLQSYLSSLLEKIPSKIYMDFPMPDLSQYIPTQMDLGSTLKFLAMFTAGFLLLGILGRMLLGRRSGANHALSSAVGILFIYAVSVAIYAFQPWNLKDLISPLPFTAFSGEYLVLFPLRSAELNSVCFELVSMLILAFLVNLLDSLLPQGKSVLGWYFLRFVTVILAMLAHLLVRWGIASYMPGVLLEYAPMILLGVLGVMLALGVLNLLLGLVLTVANPILGGIYAFFFSNLVGRQLTRAVGTTAVLTGLVYLMEHFGITALCITQSALISCAPLLLVVLILWYLIGHVL